MRTVRKRNRKMDHHCHRHLSASPHNMHLQ
ncbi:hypothetical protein GMOD_00006268 [Pyrenophora seminiperda CCB06]|uniref:Uncharacterized protein n=1 Tax=Pyrenophora seminiperda CCB06 TaxID=1302712 RepID=A0A3M7M4Q7_9PLEO|nr:hypothetical protein GMOD_00006268 [Pyrenophora seminiperda CCB06]